MVRRLLCYLIGVPGSGKSSVMRALTANHTARQADGLCPHIVYTSNTDRELPLLVELGARRSQFPGTDGLSMSVLPRAVDFMNECPHTLVVAEGDRLCTVKFWDACEGAGWTVRVVLLDMPEALAEQRRQARGSLQNRTWLKGRATKIANLAPRADHRLDATLPSEVLAQALRAYIAQERFF